MSERFDRIVAYIMTFFLAFAFTVMITLFGIALTKEMPQATGEEGPVVVMPTIFF